VFAALGDETRLALLAKLSDGAPRSVTELASGTPLTRQAISKHLQILHSAGLVEAAMRGRENLYRLSPQRLHDARKALEAISEEWDRALERLRAFVERD
jgi:DNA-binding transcriptional ArsR family regulator